MEKKLHLLRKKLFPSLFSLILCCISVSIMGQCDGWTSSFATFTNNTLDMAVDEEGSIYSIGIVGLNSSIGMDEIDLDGYPGALFVVKQDADANVVWTKSIAGDFFLVRPNITTFGNEVYFSATFTGNIEYNSVDYESVIGQNKTLLVALDLEGNNLWVKELEASNAGNHHTGGMTTDENGNLFITGRMGSDLNIDGTIDLSLEGNGTGGVYLAKFSADGVLEWAKNSVGSNVARGWAIDIDNDGNIVIGGYSSGPLQFDDNLFANEAVGFSGIVAKFDEDGNNLWVTGFPSNDFAPIYGLNIDEEDNIFIVGTLPDSTLVGGEWIQVNGTSDAYVAKILPFGVLDWAKTFGAFQASGGEWATAVNFTNEGNLLVTGQVTNGAIFEQDTLDVGPFGNVRTFLAEYTKEGEYIGATATGGNSFQVSYQGILQGDFLYLNGFYGGQGIFGNDTLIADSNNPDSLFNSSFVWKLDYSEGLQTIQSQFDTTLISGSTYELTNTGSPDYDNITWSINNGDQINNVDPLIYAFQDTAAFVCLTLSNCMSRQTVCQEFVGLLLPNIPLLTIEEATITDGSGVLQTIGTYCELRGLVYGNNYNNDGLSFTLIDPTGGIEVFNIDNNLGYSPTEGDSLHIIGTIEQLNGSNQILPESILEISANNDLREPVIVSSLGEETESELIELSCLELLDASQWTNEGIFFAVEASDGDQTFTIIIHENTDLYASAPPESKFDLVGIGLQDTEETSLLEGYYIRPRSINDLAVLPDLDAAFTTEDIGDGNFEFLATNPVEDHGYLWLVNGSPAGTGSVVQYDEDGAINISLEVCLIVNNNCSEKTEECQVVVVGGIESIRASEFVTVSPNPMTNTGLIELKNNETIEELIVFNPQGQQMIMQQSLQENKVSFETNSLAKGLYYFQIKDQNESIYIGKFLVQ